MRIGKKHQPVYRVVAIDSRNKRNGKALEYLGTYNPMLKPSQFEVDKERIQHWISVGAQPTETVAYLLGKKGIIKVAKKEYKKKPGRKASERTEAAKAAAGAEASADEPAKEESAE